MWIYTFLVWTVLGPIHGEPRIKRGEKDCTPIGYIWPITQPEPIPIYPRGCNIPKYFPNK